STVSPNVNTASAQVSTANFSDNVVYAFMVENLNGSNLLQQDLKQIHEDDLEAIDFRWQISFLSMRAKKMVHFARECRAQRNQDSRFRNQDNTRKQGNNKDTSSKVMLALDGVVFDWSDMAEEQVQTNMALMAFSDSEENSNDSFVKEQVSKDTSSFVESSLNVDKETASSVDKKIEFVKPKHHDKPVRKLVRISYRVGSDEFIRYEALEDTIMLCLRSGKSSGLQPQEHWYALVIRLAGMLVKPNVITTAATTTTTAVTRPKARGVIVQEPSEFKTTSSSQPSQLPKIKDKDYELAQRLQTEEHGELTIEEKSRLFVELMDKRKKHFARLRFENVKSKPPTKAQKRNQMYVIQQYYEVEEAFVPKDTELVKGNAKRQRLEGENEYEELKRCLEIISEDDDDNVTIKATPLSFKSPTIVDYKIYKEGMKSFFKSSEQMNMAYYLLVEKMYPFIRNILQQMWNDVKLQVDYKVEMSYDLLRLIRRQINEGYVLE
nr:hypothetical protein [Tanacetum cinerariifolium]